MSPLCRTSIFMFYSNVEGFSPALFAGVFQVCTGFVNIYAAWLEEEYDSNPAEQPASPEDDKNRPRKAMVKIVKDWFRLKKERQELGLVAFVSSYFVANIIIFIYFTNSEFRGSCMYSFICCFTPVVSDECAARTMPSYVAKKCRCCCDNENEQLDPFREGVWTHVRPQLCYNHRSRVSYLAAWVSCLMFSLQLFAFAEIRFEMEIQCVLIHTLSLICCGNVVCTTIPPAAKSGLLGHYAGL